MAKIPRKTQLVFGGSLTPTGNIPKFGSLAAGSPAYSADLAQLQTAAWLNGWAAAIIGNHSPTLEDFTTLGFVVTSQLAYLFQEGTAEWDSGTNYSNGAWSKATDGLGTVYISKQAENLNHALSDTNWWKTLASTVQGTPAGSVTNMGTPRAAQAGNLAGTVDPNFQDVYDKINDILAKLRTYPVINT